MSINIKDALVLVVNIHKLHDKLSKQITTRKNVNPQLQKWVCYILLTMSSMLFNLDYIRNNCANKLILLVSVDMRCLCVVIKGEIIGVDFVNIEL